ncbi:MAG TPA: LytR C-terminal domain-containing protein, partial [Solirubrobacteraceae bacterium]|nr:LytR C-terminal domain-containing protein [Solirubrobacteraceae bacterium]
VPSTTVPPRAGGRPGGPASGIRWPIIALVGAVVLLVVGVVVAVGGGGDDPQPAQTQEPNIVRPAPSSTTAEEPTPPGDTTVAVLNGTSVPGLAKRVATRIEESGFEVPEDLVTNAVEQNRSATVVMFVEGARDEARAVAKVIDVGSDALDVLDQNTRTLTQSRARVVVIVGADQSQQ